jgi:hypothetical protein
MFPAFAEALSGLAGEKEEFPDAKLSPLEHERFFGSNSKWERDSSPNALSDCVVQAQGVPREPRSFFV